MINFLTLLYYDPYFLAEKGGAAGPPHWVYFTRVFLVPPPNQICILTYFNWKTDGQQAFSFTRVWMVLMGSYILPFFDSRFFAPADEKFCSPLKSNSGSKLDEREWRVRLAKCSITVGFFLSFVFTLYMSLDLIFLPQAAMPLILL